MGLLSDGHIDRVSFVNEMTDANATT